jgi:hypothetical protein
LGSKGVILSGKKRNISEISVDMVKLYFSSWHLPQNMI